METQIVGALSSTATLMVARAASLHTPARACLRRKSACCQGISTSSLSSFTFNAVSAKVSEWESGYSGQRRGVVNMRAASAAAGYAGALAELALESNALDTIQKDVESIGELLKNKEIYDFLVSPIVEDEKKKSILATVAEDGKFNPFTSNFLNILVDKKRINIINEIVTEFSKMYFQLTGTEVATVASAVKIEKAQLALIAKKIQTLSGAKNVRVKNVIDPSLIAGFVVKYGKDGSRFVDMSVKGQLDRLAAQFEYAEKVGAF